MHDSSEQTMFNIPVKECIKYLGIYISKNMSDRQQLNFNNKIKKTKMILDNWLRRDLSISGRILLIKVEGLSRLFFPGLSLFVQDSTGKDINRLLVNFCWKINTILKKKVLAGKKSEGGFEMLDYVDMNNTFEINWIKKCVINPDSICFFIPHNIFKMVGGLDFILSGNFLPSKLPIKLSKFHEQALLAWKL